MVRTSSVKPLEHTSSNLLSPITTVRYTTTLRGMPNLERPLPAVLLVSLGQVRLTCKPTVSRSVPARPFSLHTVTSPRSIKDVRQTKYTPKWQPPTPTDTLTNRQVSKKPQQVPKAQTNTFSRMLMAIDSKDIDRIGKFAILVYANLY